jgi:hypothetical protein
MANFATGRCAAALLILSSILSQAASAAAEDAGAGTTPTAQPEAKSYLPPWMQDNGGAGNTGATGNNGPEAGKPVAVSEDDAKKKANSTGQGQRRHRHFWNRSFLGEIFGR